MSNKRNSLEQFYTNKNTCIFCTNIVKKYLDIDYHNDLIIEPSVGTGIFIEPIKEICKNSYFYDIDNTLDVFINNTPNCFNCNYLSVDYSEFKDNYNDIHIIGNPPFGKQSCHLFNFIKYSCNFCTTFSFILPKSFKKQSYIKKIPPYFHNIYTCDLSDNSFIFNGKSHNVPCIFAIYKRFDYPRIDKPVLYPLYYEFVNKQIKHDLSFRRVGINAGIIDISLNSVNKSSQSHYFIKFNDNIFNQDLYNKIKNIEFDNDNTVGPKSISKQELIEKFNNIIKNL